MLKNKKGFTLVEVTVSVLILAILAAIALPYYRAAVERTRIITNIGVLKALQDAVIQYYPQNNEFPARLRALHVGVSEKDWEYDGYMKVNKKDGSCSVALYPTNDVPAGEERITLYCNHDGREDWRVDFHFVINANGLAPSKKIFTITSGDSGRISTLNRAVSSAGWEKTGYNEYSLI